MQFASSAVPTVCRYDGYDPTTLPLRQQGRQTVGYRFVLGLVSLSAAERYNLRTAALQTSSASPTRQTYADGRTFVAPDTAGLQAAAALLTADEDGTDLDPRLRGAQHRARARAAYPGAMPVYAVVPTEGLEPRRATKLAKLLCYASGAGQVPGRANGQLPPATCR